MTRDRDDKIREQIEDLEYETNVGFPKSREQFFERFVVTLVLLADRYRLPEDFKSYLTFEEKIAWLENDRRELIRKARTKPFFRDHELDKLE